MHLTNNSVVYDYNSTLKGELEVKTENSLVKLDSTQLNGSQKIEPKDSTLLLYGL